MLRFNVNERITTLERLNPTPRPTMSPYLEGRWSFEWFGSNTPGSLAARLIFESVFLLCIGEEKKRSSQMSSFELELFLQWGNKKRMRRLRANKDKRQSNSSAQETFLFHSSRFSRGSQAQGAILRSRLPEKEKTERYYYATRGVVDTIGNNGEDSNSKEVKESMWPKLFVTLSSREKEEDFMVMKGFKPSHMPKLIFGGS